MKENSDSTLKKWKDSRGHVYWQHSGLVAKAKIPFQISDNEFVLEMEFSNLTARDTTYESSSKNFIAIASIYNDGAVWLGPSSLGNGTKLPDLDASNKVTTTLNVDVTYRIYDSGGTNITEKFPHDLIVSDMDSGLFGPKWKDKLPTMPNSPTAGYIESVPEAVKLEEGFSKIYKPSTYKSGLTDTGLIYNNYYGPVTGALGEESYKYAGVWVGTRSTEKKTFRIQEYYSGTKFEIASPLNANKITKTISQPNNRIGQTVKWVVRLPFPTKFRDSTSPYNNLTISDKLPEGFRLTKISTEEIEANKFITKTENSWEFKPTNQYLADKTSGEQLNFTVEAQITPNILKPGNNKAINCATTKFGDILSINTCSQPIIVETPAPKIWLEKFGDNEKITTSPIRVKPAGSQVKFTYRITNASYHEPIQISSLKDNKLGQIISSCPKQTLQPRESILCTIYGKI